MSNVGPHLHSGPKKWGQYFRRPDVPLHLVQQSVAK
jgi:hypothetical protein